MKTKQNKTNPRRILGYLMALVMVLFTNGNAWAQTTVTVGTGTTVAAGINGVPVYRSTATSSFHHAKSVQLLTASQLAGAGIGPGSNISSWAYYRTIAGMPAGSNAWTLNVYLKNVSNTALASGTSWDGLISGATLAYSTTINAASPAAVGWWTWPTTGFTYTGGSVMACIEWVPVGTIVSPAFTAGMSFLYTASTGYQAMGTSSTAPILGTYATWSLSATSNARFYNTQITYTDPPAGYGCMDPTACNYDPAATVAGSCNADLGCGCNGSFSNPAAGAGLDCFGNCLNGASTIVYTAGTWSYENSFTITDCNGAVLASMPALATGTNSYNSSCVISLPATYFVNLTDFFGDGWNGGVLNINGVSYTQTGTNAANVAQVFQVGGPCPVYGCMDPTAANYNTAATVDDGTCTYGIPGCTDVAACNFDANATANNGSCTYAATGYDCAGNCLNGGTTYTISVTGGLYPSEVSWTVTNSAGTVVLLGGAPYSSTLCVPADCYTLNMLDSWGDGWNGAVLSLSTGGLTVGTATIAIGSTGTANFGLGAICPVYGCTDPTATNYNAGANTDNGSCVYACTAAPYCENFNLGVGTWTNNGWINDANGTPSADTGPNDDITGGGFYMFYETSGSPQNPITLTSECFDISGLTAPTLSFYNSMYGATTGSLNVYVNGTVVWTMSGNQGPQWNFEQVNLSAYAGTNVTIMFEATYGGGFTGDIAIDQVCLDEFIVVLGCIDPVATNYNASANTDDGSCTYCTGTMLSLNMGDTWGDGWNGAAITFTGNTTGTVFGPYTIATGNSGVQMMCMPTDCYAINVTAGNYPDEVFWTVTNPATGAVLASFGNSTYPANGAPYSNQGGLGVGVTCPVYGCTDATALNYNALASADDGSCVYLCDVYVASASVTTVPSCNGAFDASATALIAGSFGNDFWLWDNGSTSSTITGVGAGTYSCTITDSVNLCTSTVSVTILPTPVISIVGATIDATPGNANGIINLTLSGGTPCYNGAAMSLAGASSTTTQWASNAFDVVAASDLQITAISQPSMAGFGSANVWYRLGSGLGHEADPNGWMLAGSGVLNAAFIGAVSTITLSNPISMTAGQTICIYVQGVGINVVFGSGASPTYSATVSSDANLAIISGFATGGGPGSGTTYPSPSSYDFAGSLNYSLSSYNYAWSDGQTTQNATGLPLGPISVTVTDCDGCTATDSWFVLTNYVYGCTDPLASNFSATANTDDGTCLYDGCTDATANNYDASANNDDGSCTYACMHPNSGSWDDELTVTFSPDWYSSEASWTITNALTGAVVLASTPYANGGAVDVHTLCAMDGCYYLNGYDSFGDGWGFGAQAGTLEVVDAAGNVIGFLQLQSPSISGSSLFTVGSANCTLGCTDIAFANYNANAVIDDGSCANTISGCTDPLAANYTPYSNVDDGSCCYSNPVSITVGAGSFQGEVGWTLSNSAGTVVLTGGAPYASTACLVDDCYTVNMTDSWGDGWNGNTFVATVGGVVIGSGGLPSGYAGSFTFAVGTGSCFVAVYGCTDPTATNYNAGANTDDGSCTYCVYGCMDASATNYDANATCADNSCTYCVYGCIDASAFNYNANATCDDGSCIPYTYGCTDPSADNYNPSVNTSDNSCVWLGCTDPTASNYDATATVDDGSCTYAITGCTNPLATNYNALANTACVGCCVFPTTCSTNAAPTGLFVDGIIHTRATINWTNMNSTTCFVDQYRIQYRKVGNTAWLSKTMGAPLGTCGANGTTGIQKTDKELLDLLPSTTYQYQMKAWYCGGGVSSWTTTNTFTTAGNCPNISNLTVTTPTTTKATFTWSTSNGAYSFVRLKARVDTLSNPVDADWFMIGGSGVNYPAVTKDKNGLLPGQTYRGQGRTFCDPNGGAYMAPSWTALVTWTQPTSIRLEGGESIANLDVYPNPSRDVFNVTFTSEDVQDLEVRVINIVGEVVYTENLQQFVGEYTKSIDLVTYTKGVYFLEITTNNGVVNKKLILQ